SDCSKLIADLNTKSWSDSNCLVVIIFTSAGDLVIICVAHELNSATAHKHVIIFFILIYGLRLISSGYDRIIDNNIVIIESDDQIKRFTTGTLAGTLPRKKIS